MKELTLRRFSKISGFLLTGLLLCSCSTPIEIADSIGQSSVEQQEILVESEAACVDTATSVSVCEAIRKEEQKEATSTPGTESIPVVTEEAVVKKEPIATPTEVSTAASPGSKSTVAAKPTACPTATPFTPLPEVNESKAAPTPKSTSQSTATPTAQPTAQPTEKPLPTATPVPTIAPTATPKPTATPTPIPTAVPKIEEVWIVDVPGHYETVEKVAEVWVDEQGHWEKSGYWASDWVFECNQCGMQYSMEEAVNQHLDDSFDWDTMTGHSSYTQVSGPMYWVETEPEWVVDIPGHYETVTESKEIWIDEQSHWENVGT